MNLIANYDTSEDEETLKNKRFCALVPKVNTTPDVDISSLMLKKQNEDQSKLEKIYNQP